MASLREFLPEWQTVLGIVALLFVLGSVAVFIVLAVPEILDKFVG